jgi:cytochrome c oxidase cbb3-type subunit IV
MDIDINTLRAVITTLLLVAFIGIAVWAWSGRNRARFDEAARLPLHDD